MLAEALQVTLQVVRVFETLDVPYLVGGSLASSFRGVPRATVDADLVVDLGPESIEALVRALEPAFYVDSEAVREAVERAGSFNVIHLATLFKIDVFVAGNDALTRTELSRRERIVVGPDPGDALEIATSEDVVLQKLRWYRLGNEISDRQWQDVLGVLKVHSRQLDLAYLAKWANSEGLSDLLVRALNEAGIT